MHTILKKYCLLISSVLVSLFGGMLITLFILQYDPTIKSFFGKQIIALFESSLKCSMHATLNSINFFQPTIELSDVTVQPKENNRWQWHCSTYTMNFSWLRFLWYGSINLHMTLEGLKACSDIIDNQPAIFEHVQEIIRGFPKDIPLSLKSIIFKKASLLIKDACAQNTALLAWSGESKIIGSSFKSHLHFVDGFLKTANRMLFNQLSGTLECYAPKDKNDEPFVVRINCSLGLPHLNTSNKNCFLTGYFLKDHGLFTLQSTDGSLICGPMRLTESAGNLIGEMCAQFPLSYIGNLLSNTYEDGALSGMCTVHTKAYLTTTPCRLFGTISLNDFAYKNHLISPFSKLSFSKQNRQWNGLITMQCEQEGLLEGTVKYDEILPHLTFSLFNKKKITHALLDYWEIKPNDLSCSLSFDQTSTLTGSYHLAVSQSKIHTNHTVDGSATVDNQSFCTQGTFNNNTFDVTCSLFPDIRLTQFKYTDPGGKVLAQLHSQNNNHTRFEGIITFPFIKTVISQSSPLDLQGEGDIKIWSVHHPDKIRLKMHLDHGTIRLPHTYNFINGFDAISTIDLTKNEININHAQCRLHKGCISCTGAIAKFRKNGTLDFTQIPLLFDSCLINNKDDLFSVVSGNLLFTNHIGELPHIEGSFFLDRTQLKENIFSYLLKKEGFSFNPQLWNLYKDGIICNLIITTQSPIRINTPFLETMANINLIVKQNIKNPDISGAIKLLSGSINFPYKPLYITKAHCHFMPQQPYDPIIEIIAKNKIKKYTITMYVNGSLQDHTIRLESAPPLSEEQIIALLLAGSEEESLSIVAPALIMQNIKHLIFSSTSALPNLDSYVKKVFNPFKHIHLVPSFIDQTGRGGLRAAIEIDINEQWRACIQKNFSLSEDTRFEVDYFLSDDICFKGVRDEHRDVSAEVEMRWKF